MTCLIIDLLFKYHFTHKMDEKIFTSGKKGSKNINNNIVYVPMNTDFNTFHQQKFINFNSNESVVPKRMAMEGKRMIMEGNANYSERNIRERDLKKNESEEKFCLVRYATAKYMIALRQEYHLNNMIPMEFDYCMCTPGVILKFSYSAIKRPDTPVIEGKSYYNPLKCICGTFLQEPYTNRHSRK